jgi:hypothetical protein
VNPRRPRSRGVRRRGRRWRECACATPPAVMRPTTYGLRALLGDPIMDARGSFPKAREAAASGSFRSRTRSRATRSS